MYMSTLLFTIMCRTIALLSLQCRLHIKYLLTVYVYISENYVKIYKRYIQTLSFTLWYLQGKNYSSSNTLLCQWTTESYVWHKKTEWMIICHLQEMTKTAFIKAHVTYTIVQLQEIYSHHETSLEIQRGMGRWGEKVSKTKVFK